MVYYWSVKAKAVGPPAFASAVYYSLRCQGRLAWFWEITQPPGTPVLAFDITPLWRRSRACRVRREGSLSEETASTTDTFTLPGGSR
jgi:hypothetical protein